MKKKTKNLQKKTHIADNDSTNNIFLFLKRNYLKSADKSSDYEYVSWEKFKKETATKKHLCNKCLDKSNKQVFCEEMIEFFVATDMPVTQNDKKTTKRISVFFNEKPFNK